MMALFANIKPATKRERPRCEIWDAVVLAFNLKPVTKRECTRVGGIVRDLKLKEATPAMIAAAVDRYRATMPRMIVTPEAMLKHWDMLQSEIATVAPVDDMAGFRFDRPRESANA